MEEGKSATGEAMTAASTIAKHRKELSSNNNNNNNKAKL